MAVAKQAVARGKGLLIQAAMKLAMRTRSIGALGVREIGREAGLNPNTFYRHFGSLDDLGMAILQDVILTVRGPMRDMRRDAAESVESVAPGEVGSSEHWANCLRKTKVVVTKTVDLYFDYILKNPEAFTIVVSEMTGPSPLLRERIQEVVADMSADLSQDIRIYQLLPMLSDKSVQDLSAVITRQIFMLSTEYIDAPDSRNDMEEAASNLIMGLIAGAIAMEIADPVTMAELLTILRDDS